MEKGLQIIKFQKQSIRMIVVGGEPLWFLADILAVIHMDHRRVKRILNESEYKTYNTFWSNCPEMPKKGCGRPPLLVTESGLYKLVQSSQLAIVKDFNNWITSQVLPQIRKTGVYIPATPDKTLVVSPEVKHLHGRILMLEKSQAEAIEGIKKEKEVAEKRHQELLDLIGKALPQTHVALLPAVVPPKTLRASLNEVVRGYAKQMFYPFSICWEYLYSQVYSLYSFNLPLQARNRGVDPLDLAERMGVIDRLVKLAQHLYVEHPEKTYKSIWDWMSPDQKMLSLVYGDIVSVPVSVRAFQSLTGDDQFDWRYGIAIDFSDSGYVKVVYGGLYYRSKTSAWFHVTRIRKVRGVPDFALFMNCFKDELSIDGAEDVKKEGE